MLAKLKHIPKSFSEAVKILQDRVSLKLGNNTWLEVSDADPARGFIGVRLHNTFIVKFWPDGQITLHTRGAHTYTGAVVEHRTVTTKDRINQFIKGRVYQQALVWYFVRNRGELDIDWANPTKFTEGINVA